MATPITSSAKPPFIRPVSSTGPGGGSRSRGKTIAIESPITDISSNATHYSANVEKLTDFAPGSTVAGTWWHEVRVESDSDGGTGGGSMIDMVEELETHTHTHSNSDIKNKLESFTKPVGSGINTANFNDETLKRINCIIKKYLECQYNNTKIKLGMSSTLGGGGGSGGGSGGSGKPQSGGGSQNPNPSSGGSNMPIPNDNAAPYGLAYGPGVIGYNPNGNLPGYAGSSWIYVGEYSLESIKIYNVITDIVTERINELVVDCSITLNVPPKPINIDINCEPVSLLSNNDNITTNSNTNTNNSIAIETNNQGTYDDDLTFPFNNNTNIGGVNNILGGNSSNTGSSNGSGITNTFTITS